MSLILNFSDANMLIEAVSFSSAGKVQPFLVSVSSNASLVLDIHCHLKKEEVYGYLAGTWDLNSHSEYIFSYLLPDHRNVLTRYGWDFRDKTMLNSMIVIKIFSLINSSITK